LSHWTPDRRCSTLHVSIPPDRAESSELAFGTIDSWLLWNLTERYLGVKIPPTNLQSDDLEQARSFAGTLADRVAAGHAA
jgi:hypothetical protein